MIGMERSECLSCLREMDDLLICVCDVVDLANLSLWVSVGFD